MPSLVLAFLRHPKLVGRPLRPAAHRSVSAYTLKDYMQIPATATTLEALRTAIGTLRPGAPGTRARTTAESDGAWKRQRLPRRESASPRVHRAHSIKG